MPRLFTGLMERGGVKHIYQFGIRSADAAEVAMADQNTRYFSRGEYFRL